MSDVWIINGIPGAGKTTVARALAARFSRSVHLEGDRLQEWIVSGSVPPGGTPPEEERRQIVLNIHHQCLLARSYAQAGFTPVIDYVVVSRSRVEEYRAALGGLCLRLVTLAPGTAVALERDRQRPEKTVAALWTHLDEQMRADMCDMGLWVDNAGLTVAETADYVFAHQDAARV